jgi:hypothetical protein
MFVFRLHRWRAEVTSICHVLSSSALAPWRVFPEGDPYLQMGPQNRGSRPGFPRRRRQILAETQGATEGSWTWMFGLAN